MPNEVFTPQEISEDGFFDTEEGIADIVGSKMEFMFDGIVREYVILYAALNVDVKCPNCEIICKACLLMKTEDGEILACKNCNEFVMEME